MSARYVYAIVPASFPEFDAIDAAGVDDMPVDVFRAAGLSALVSVVNADETWDENDVDRIEARLRAHQRIIDRAFSVGPVVPTRFGTVLPSTDVLADWMAREGDRLRGGLARTDGLEEWTLTVTWDASEAYATLVPPLAVDAMSGAGYLRARAAERDAAETVSRRRDELARELHQRFAVAARLAEQQPHSFVADGEAEVVLHGRYVIERDGSARFADAVATALDERPELRLRAELSGPWPVSLVDGDGA